jgi:homoserine kinase
MEMVHLLIIIKHPQNLAVSGAGPTIYYVRTSTLDATSFKNAHIDVFYKVYRFCSVFQQG